MVWRTGLTQLRQLAVLAGPALLLLAACDDPSPTTVSDASIDSPTAVASAQVASPSPAPVAVAPADPVQAPAPDPYAAATAAGATAVCADGTWSYSKTRSGTCSHHGGVHWWTGNLGPAGPGAH